MSAELTPAGLRLRFPALVNQRYSLQVSEALELGIWSSLLEVPALPNARTIERTEPSPANADPTEYLCRRAHELGQAITPTQLQTVPTNSLEPRVGRAQF